MKEGRKFPACSLFTNEKGYKVGVVVGGLDRGNNPIKSAEAFNDANGEWVPMPSLRSVGGVGTLNVVRQRLTFIGGREDEGVSSSIQVYNKQTGWHLTNLQLNVGRTGHISKVANVGQVSINGLEQPNILVAFGQSSQGETPNSEAVCFSQKSNFFDPYCVAYDAIDELRHNTYGSSLFPYPEDILSCGGIFEGEVTSDCYSLNPTSSSWDLSPLSLLSKRHLAAVAKTPVGDWVISGGFVGVPTRNSNPSTQTVEMISVRKHQFEKNLANPVAQHCFVHYHCFYFFNAGGTSVFTDIAMNSVQYHHFKTGNYHVLEPMKVARANHVCFAIPGPGKKRKVYLVTLVYNTLTHSLATNFPSSMLLVVETGSMVKKALKK